MYRLFGIPNCDTVKKTRTFLEKKKIHFEFIDFKKNPPTPSDIIRWSEAFGGLPVNTKGTTYKKLKDEFEALPDKAKISFLCENASMIKRPVFEKNGVVLSFGFDEKQLESLL